jgi:hypothetical protein
VRVLLDECVPRKLKGELPGHDVRTVPEMGWAGSKNGDLLLLAAGRFDVFLTVDRRMRREHDFVALNLALVVLKAMRNDIDVLRQLMPEVRAVLPLVQPGQVREVG